METTNKQSKPYCKRDHLIKAARFGKTKLVKALCKSMVDINYEDETGWTALMEAAMSDNVDTLKVLIEYGANLNYKNSKGDSALLLATKAFHSEHIKALLEAGANVNIKDKNGNTPLIEAARRFDTAYIADILIKAGANVDAENNNGWTALMHAAQEGFPYAVEFLLKSGADAKRLNNDDETALDIVYKKTSYKEVPEGCSEEYNEFCELKEIYECGPYDGDDGILEKMYKEAESLKEYIDSVKYSEIEPNYVEIIEMLKSKTHNI